MSAALCPPHHWELPPPGKSTRTPWRCMRCGATRPAPEAAPLPWVSRGRRGARDPLAAGTAVGQIRELGNG